jgi:hypothetical protein
MSYAQVSANFAADPIRRVEILEKHAPRSHQTHRRYVIEQGYGIFSRRQGQLRKSALHARTGALDIDRQEPTTDREQVVAKRPSVDAGLHVGAQNTGLHASSAPPRPVNSASFATVRSLATVTGKL